MIRPIQYLRALSAMMVVWVHSLHVIPDVAEQLGTQYFSPNSFVDIFFLISGFVMVVTTARKTMTPQEFFRLRIIRVVPLYWLATIAMVAIGMIASVVLENSFRDMTYPLSAIAKSLLFIPYAAIPGVPGSVWPIVQQGWTLNYEMFFYLLFALSLAAPRRFRLPGLVAVLGLLAVVGKLFGPFSIPLLSVYTSALLLGLVGGMILAHVWLRDESRTWLPQTPLLVALGFYAIGSRNSVFVNMCGAFVIFACCLHPRVCAIRNRPLMELGNASYSLYLIHQFVLDALAWIWLRVFPTSTWVLSALFMGTALTLCAAAGLLCYRYIEKPLTSRLMEYARRTRSVGGEAPSLRSSVKSNS